MGLCTSCYSTKQDPLKKDLLQNQYTKSSPANSASVETTVYENREGRSDSDQVDDPMRVSLPVAPSQVVRTQSFAHNRVHEQWRHVSKDGFLVKQGHKFRNWKRRYFILGNGMLRYYEAAGPRIDDEPRGQKEKGFVPLAGATITKKISDLGRCKLTLTTASGEKNQVLEAENPLDLDQWYDAITQEILAANVDSLRNGERIEEVEQWYRAQHQKYEDAMQFIRFGNLVLLHIIDTSGLDHLVSSWIQANKDNTGFLINIAKDKQLMQEAAARGTDVSSLLSPIQKEIDGTNILFKHVQYAQMGATKSVKPSSRLGPTACIFSIVTSDDAYDIEVESPTRAEDWVRAVNDAASFSRLPVPAARRS